MHGSLSQMSHEYSAREKPILNQGENQGRHEVTSLEMLDEPEEIRPCTIDLRPTKDDKFEF